MVEQWEHLDILVNSAGIVQDGLLGAMTQQQWQDVIATNLGGTFNYCHAVTQPMMMQRQGSIVNLSSTAAEFAARGQVNYAASKGGINGLTRALAKELAVRKVRVNAVAPGMIETDMSQVVRGVAGDQIKNLIPLKRIGSPDGGRPRRRLPRQRRRVLRHRPGPPRRRRPEPGRILEARKHNFATETGSGMELGVRSRAGVGNNSNDFSSLSLSPGTFA